MSNMKIEVESPNVTYSEEYIQAEYDYQSTDVKQEGNKIKVINITFDSFEYNWPKF